MYSIVKRNHDRIKRHRRHIKKLKGTAECPRLSVFKSLRQLYVQVIDDTRGVTLLGASTMSPVFKERASRSGVTCENAAVLGKLVAEQCLEKEVKQVVFDRNGYPYHGRIQSLAEAARETGLKF